MTPFAEGADAALRKYATQATLALSLVVGITGVMMFYRLFKPEVQGMHEWLGMGFVAVAVLHGLRHRKGLPAMLGQPRTRLLLGVTALAAAGFLVLAPAKQANPARQLTNFALQAKLKDLAPVVGVPAEVLASRLGAASVDLSIADTAKAHHADPMAELAKALKK